MSRRNWIAGTALVVTLSSLACVSERGPAPVASQVDSAGVRVITNSARGAWGRAGPWTVKKDLSIGIATGAPEYQFGRVVDVGATSDGRIYVLDQMAAEVRVFDAEGVFLFSFGGLGEGPGEFSDHRPLGANELSVTDYGEILVADQVNNRLTRFNTEGDYLGSVPLGVPEAEPIVSNWHPNGGYAVHKVVWDRTWNGVVRIDPRDGEIMDTLLAFPFQPNGWGRVDPDERGRTEALMHSPLWAIMPDGRIVSGMSDESWFEIRTADGDLSTIVRRHEENPVLTETEQQRFLDSLMDLWTRMFEAEDQPEDWIEAEIRRGYGIYIPPERLPAITGFAPGPAGTIWVRQAVPVTEMTVDILYQRRPLQEFWGPDWDVFSSTGVLLGQIALPSSFTVTSIQETAIYGVEVDEASGVQRVLRLLVQTGDRD